MIQSGEAEKPADRNLSLIATLVLICVYALLAFLALGDGAVPAQIIFASAGLAAGLVALSVIDLQTMRLPDFLTMPLIIAGILLAYGLDWSDPFWHIAAAVVGYLLIHCLALAYRSLRHRDGIGMGDAKLFAAAGAWLGPSGLPSTLLWSCLAALITVLIWRLARRPLSRFTKIPFGPFLAIGFWIVWLFGPVV